MLVETVLPSELVMGETRLEDSSGVAAGDEALLYGAGPVLSGLTSLEDWPEVMYGEGAPEVGLATGVVVSSVVTLGATVVVVDVVEVLA